MAQQEFTDPGTGKDLRSVPWNRDQGYSATCRKGRIMVETGHIHDLLNGMPEVRFAAVSSSGEEVTCYVVLNLDAVRNDITERSLVREDDWRFVFDTVYGGEVAEGEEMDVAAFTSAYTRQPFSVTDMREWVDGTVAQILPWLPDRPRILEIGCGTGLVLAELAPRSERYAVVDFSASALERLRKTLRHKGLDQVEYHHSSADRLPADLRDFDAVVIAQVSQYFPSEDYLRRVLTGALERVRPTGLVYVDVRSLPLLETFHLSVERCTAPAAPAATVLAGARQRLRTEEELVVHPSFFLDLAGTWGGRARVEPRCGRGVKEMNAYRYDVLLTPAAPGGTSASTEWLSWGDRGWTPERLAATLGAERPSALALTGIPHALLAEDVAAHHRLAREYG